MRTFPLRRFTYSAAAAVIALVLGAGSLRAEESFVIDADELDSFTVDTTELLPPRSDEDVDDDDPVIQPVPLAPADMADPAMNLVPLPAPLVSAVIGFSAVALRAAWRGRRCAAAGVFRRRR